MEEMGKAHLRVFIFLGMVGNMALVRSRGDVVEIKEKVSGS